MAGNIEWSAKDEVRGIRGWLLLPLAQLGFDIACMVWFAARRLPGFSVEAARQSRAFPVLYITITFGCLAFLIYCLIRFLQERYEAPWLLTLLNAVVLVFSVKALLDGMSPFMLMQALLSVAMIVYLHTSVRVKNTFFRSART